MEATELHRLAMEILREAIGERASEVSISAWCHVTGSESFVDYSLFARCDLPGKNFHEQTGAGLSFVRTPEECLAMFRRDVLPALCNFMGVSGCPEYDPIAMGA